jgi:malonyl CoA-acyl carrier protein transacylase
MSQAKEGAMAAVLKIDEATLKTCLAEHQLPHITVANYNSAMQLVISGAKDDIARAKSPLQAAGALFFPLNTSGAFHSPYMETAKQTFSQFIQQFHFNSLRCPVIANITAQPYQQAAIAATLVEQITHSVQWQASIEYLLQQGVTQFEEIGPGTVLTKLVEAIKNSVMETVSTPNPPPPATASVDKSPHTLQQRIAQWNAQHPIGTKVQVTGYADLLETQTEALLLFGHRAAIYLKNYNGYFDLDDITPAH